MLLKDVVSSVERDLTSVQHYVTWKRVALRLVKCSSLIISTLDTTPDK